MRPTCNAICKNTLKALRYTIVTYIILQNERDAFSSRFLAFRKSTRMLALAMCVEQWRGHTLEHWCNSLFDDTLGLFSHQPSLEANRLEAVSKIRATAWVRNIDCQGPKFLWVLKHNYKSAIIQTERFIFVGGRDSLQLENSWETETGGNLTQCWALIIL